VFLAHPQKPVIYDKAFGDLLKSTSRLSDIPSALSRQQKASSQAYLDEKDLYLGTFLIGGNINGEVVVADVTGDETLKNLLGERRQQYALLGVTHSVVKRLSRDPSIITQILQAEKINWAGIVSFPDQRQLRY